MPFLEFSLHPIVDNSELVFKEGEGTFHSNNTFVISSSFYNSKAGVWEPVLEKFTFTQEIDINPINEYKKKIDIIAEKGPLNLDISDEMVRIVLF